MSVYKKLAKARVELQKVEMRKSGANTYTNYRYFELGDFMPHINRIFDELGLCGYVSFYKEEAILQIVDVDAPETNSIVITSPMADATLKGAHPIQNLGAAETYQRRYLWITALEIVEHDALSGSAPIADKIEVDLTDFQSALESATDLKNLMEIWNTIPKEHHKSLKSKAAEVKAKLESQQ